MDPFDAFASTRDTLWSLIALGPVGLATQYFIDPQTGVPSAAPEAAIRQVRNRARLHHLSGGWFRKEAGLIG